MSFRLNTFCDVLVNLAPDGDFDYQPEQWKLVCNVWAEVKPKKAEEQITGEKVSDVVQERAIVRYRDNIMAGMRLQSSTKCWDINTVADLKGERQYLELGVTECQKTTST